MRAIFLGIACFVFCLALPLARAQSQGAPFCVVWAGNQECTFYSAQDCRQRASQLDGACVANNQTSQSRPSAWDSARQGYELGRRQREDRDVGDLSARIGAWRDFCRRMTAQDSAELDRLTANGATPDAEWERKLDMYQQRTHDCYALAQP